MSKITITATWETLAAMDDNGNHLYHTPGSKQPYWDSRPNFRDDSRVASVYDFTTDDGFGYSRDLNDWPDSETTEFSVEVII